ncbi:unnamed protein product, partial [Protopolystoma xenopodis]
MFPLSVHLQPSFVNPRDCLNNFQKRLQSQLICLEGISANDAICMEEPSLALLHQPLITFTVATIRQTDEQTTGPAESVHLRYTTDGWTNHKDTPSLGLINVQELTPGAHDPLLFTYKGHISAAQLDQDVVDWLANHP